MELNKQAYLREDIEAMDNHQLNRLLQAELEKESRDIDADLVRTILSVLEGRGSDSKLETNESVQVACNKYRMGCEIQKANSSTVKKKAWFSRVAAAAAVVCLLFLAVPIVSGDAIIAKFITRVTENLVSFLNPSQVDNQIEYVYQTDHPGLQQVYDSVSDLGITEPVVPSWIPEEYNLREIKTETSPAKTRVVAKFETADKTLVLYYDLYGIAAKHEYHKDKTPVDNYERAGIIHDIYLNNEKYFVFWERDNLECFIAVDCQEDSLIEILKSIYMMEDE